MTNLMWGKMHFNAVVRGSLECCIFGIHSIANLYDPDPVVM